jgi:hypothetical protein
MYLCTRCGYPNEENAETCPHCHTRLTEPREDATLPEEEASAEESLPTALPVSDSHSFSQGQFIAFLLGVWVGLVPAIMFALGWQDSWGFSGCYLFIIVLLALAICLSQRASRPFGYGLLTAVVVSPVIVAISCFATPYRLHA